MGTLARDFSMRGRPYLCQEGFAEVVRPPRPKECGTVYRDREEHALGLYGRIRYLPLTQASGAVLVMRHLRCQFAQYHRPAGAGGGWQIRGPAPPCLISEDGERDGLLGIDIDAVVGRGG